MRFQRLDDWLAWQAGLHPEEIELGLERVVGVWRRLRPTGLGCRVVTVAGTNGKGSSVAMLEAIYLQAGYRVGSYTSPHLVRYNERVRVDGRAVSDRQLCQAFEQVDVARQEVALTYFEFGTLAALEIFAGLELDLVVLEVGLGGRLDAVNIIDPDVALITTVDLDHQNWLGTSREAIGREKAGIMRAGKPVVLASEMPATVYREARELGAQIYRSGQEFHVESTADGFSWFGRDRQYLGLPQPALRGDYQIRNAAAVLMVCQCLSQSLPVERAAIGKALQAVRLPGRMQILAGTPPIILDVAHNPQAVLTLRDQLAELAIAGKVHAIFGILGDKDLASILDIIAPRVASWHLVDTPGPRGQSAAQLRVRLADQGIDRNLFTCGGVAKALESARSLAGAGDAILVFGSFLVVGEFLESFSKMETIELI